MIKSLVFIDELAQHIGDPNWVIVDCRHTLADFSAGRRMYDAGHIPGAFFARAEDDMSGPKTGFNGRHPLPDPTVFLNYLRSLGVNDDTQLVAYDAGGDMFAARFWFLTKWIGIESCACLDGGLAAWTASGHPVTTEATPLPSKPGNVTPHPLIDPTLEVSDVLAWLRSPSMLLLDARGADRFAGENETIDPVAGHIPGAINRHFRLNYDAEGRFKSPQVLREEFEALGAGDASRVVHQCGSGVSAAVNMLAMELAGLRGSHIYPGSWSEWCADPSRPVAVGPN